MEKCGILDKLIGLSKLCINELKAMVRVDEETLCYDIFSINNGVRQGDIISPILFNLAVDEVMQKTKELQRGQLDWELT